jgi:transcriptional regulator with XRE-family HTH domain
MVADRSGWPAQELWKAHLERLGEYIKTERRFRQLSQRQLADMANLSDTYMSQLERGLHEPSIRVLRALATSLGLDPEDLIRRAASVGDDPDTKSESLSTEAAIRRDERLTDAQKRGLLSVLHSYLDDS